MSSSATSEHPEQSQIERLLSVRRLEGPEHGLDTFTNRHPLQCPPWARGAYGGHVIALALVAGYETTPSGSLAHSIHCHFLHAANVALPLVFVVQRARDTKKIATRVIEAMQENKLVFTATASFGLGKQDIHRSSFKHSPEFPSRVGQPPPEHIESSFRTQSPAGQGGLGQPCDCVRVPKLPSVNIGNPASAKFCQWMRARGRIQNGQRYHDAALAYMSDNYFIGTTFRTHGASRFAREGLSQSIVSKEGSAPMERREREKQLYFEALAAEERAEIDGNSDAARYKTVDWLVTLNHTIYFHRSGETQADDWMLAEMDSPWAGSERSIVTERIWSHGGTLLATCFQEGMIRLVEPPQDQVKNGSKI